MSFKKKRQILEAYSKLPSSMPKEKAASTLNITRPYLYKLLKEKDLICSPDSRNNDMNSAMIEQEESMRLGVREGHGRFVAKDRSNILNYEYVGYWKDNKRHGKGRCY